MKIDWDVGIQVSDGLTLRCDVFRPDDGGKYPPLVSYGPYGKGLPFSTGYPDQWSRLVTDHPEVVANSSGKYQNWETPDPERWVGFGYACVRVDSRGAGRSPGLLDPFSPRETQDLYDVIEWAADQSWSSGKVGLTGISYLAINQWHVASLQPPHLEAMIPWEGAADWYRDMTHHGGILSVFWENWFEMQVLGVQHGFGSRGDTNPHTGELVAGPITLDDQDLLANRVDLGEEIRSRPFDDVYYRERSPDWSKVTVPFLSAGNWGGHGLHLRGNVEGFARAGSEEKWLEIHGLEHWTHYYTDYGIELQRSFFDHYLKDVDNGWDKRPRVTLNVRTVDGFERREHDEWPIKETEWTRLYLDCENTTLTSQSSETSTSLSYDPDGPGITFNSEPFGEATEVTGPISARLFVSTESDDTDIFAVVRAFTPQEEEVLFQGAVDPAAPLAQGWLRASHRKLDSGQSLPYRPYHVHDSAEPLKAGQIYQLDIEIWPTSFVFPEGHRLALTILGRDYTHDSSHAGRQLSTFKNVLAGSGPFLHNDPIDRPMDRFDFPTTIHSGGRHKSSVLLPIVPRGRS